MASSLSPDFYARGLSLYQAGVTLRIMMEQTDSFRIEHDAEHEAVDKARDPNVDKVGDAQQKHQAISDRYRGAEQSFILGFADGALADLRLIAAQRRGQRA